MLTLVEFLLWVPEVEPNHTQALAGLFTAAWQHPCQCLSAGALKRAGAGGLLGDSAAAGQLHLTRRRHDDQLSAQQQHQAQPATLCSLPTGV